LAVGLRPWADWSVVQTCWVWVQWVWRLSAAGCFDLGELKLAAPVEVCVVALVLPKGRVSCSHLKGYGF